MLKKISFIVGVMVLTFLWIVPISFAEQSGDEYYGTSDVYGVYITAPDGTISYIWFWTEDARKMIMGDLSAPGTDVMGIPEGGIPIGKYPLDGPEKDPIKNITATPQPFYDPTEEPEKTEVPNHDNDDNNLVPNPKYMVVISCSGTAPGKSLKDSIVDQASNFNQIRFVNDVEMCAADNYIGVCGDYILNVKCYEVVPPTDNEGTFFPFGGIVNSHSKVHNDMDICSMWYYCDRWYGRYGENFSGVTDCEDLSEELDIALGSCAVPESFAGGYKQLR